MIWVLIMFAYRGGIATVEFKSENECLAARAQVVREYGEMASGSGNLSAMCIKR